MAIYVLIFIIGLALGSFFNVVLFRFNTNKSPLKGRSECANCGSVIKWFDLIPVASYLILKRKCRKCKEKISSLYPIVEISAAFVLLLFFLKTPTVSFSTALGALSVLLFLLLVFFDIRYFIIPDKVLLPLAIAAIGSKSLDKNANFYWLAIFALGLTAFFAILYLLSRGRWIGLGDIKLIFLIGFLLGYPMGYLAVLSSVWLAAIFSIALLAAKKADAKTEIPFGSFLSATTIIFIIFNSELQKISNYFY